MAFLGVLIMQSQLTGSDESTFLYHSSCPSCGSSDGNSVYSDGHTYCFVCNAYSSGGDDDSGKQKKTAMLKGNPVKLGKRGLSEETCRKYRIHKDGETLRMHYFDKNGQVCAAKVKTKDKDFWMEGNNTEKESSMQPLDGKHNPNGLMYPYQMVQRLQRSHYKGF